MLLKKKIQNLQEMKITRKCLPLNIFNAKIYNDNKNIREKYKFQKLGAYISDRVYGRFKQELSNDVEIICYDGKINLPPQTLLGRVWDWYRLYLDRPGGSRLDKNDPGGMLPERPRRVSITVR